MKPEHHFHLKDGNKLKDLFELTKSLEEMPEEVFNHHVSEHRNDFYNWIKDVIGDEELATLIKRSKTKKEMQKHLGEVIKEAVAEEVKEKKLEKPVVEKPMEKKPNPVIAKPVEKVAPKVDAKPAVKKVEKKIAKPKVVKAKKTKPKVKTVSLPARQPHEHCPHKTFHCGVLEFMIGVLVGLLLEFIIITML